MSTKKLFK